MAAVIQYWLMKSGYFDINCFDFFIQLVGGKL
jgi:hypothetical protein